MFKSEQLHLWQSSMKNSSGITVSSTSPWFSVGLLAVQRWTKTWILNYSFLARRFGGLGNFEAARELNWASAHLPLLRFFWGSTQAAGAASNNRGSTDGKLFNSSFFASVGDSLPTTRSKFFWGQPHITHRIPVVFWKLDCPDDLTPDWHMQRPRQTLENETVSPLDSRVHIQHW